MRVTVASYTPPVNDPDFIAQIKSLADTSQGYEWTRPFVLNSPSISEEERTYLALKWGMM